MIRTAALDEMARVTVAGGTVTIATWASLDCTPGYEAMVALIDDERVDVVTQGEYLEKQHASQTRRLSDVEAEGGKGHSSGRQVFHRSKSIHYPDCLKLYYRDHTIQNQNLVDRTRDLLQLYP